MARAPRKPRAKVVCIECGRLVHTGGNLRCAKCRAVDRQCETCEKTFRSADYRKCSACRAPERICVDCGSTFKGHTSRCNRCQSSERECATCGSRFIGRGYKCDSCRHDRDYECSSCGKAIRGNSKCQACSAKVRECSGCGLVIRGTRLKCYYCRGVERTCNNCGQVFVGDSPNCSPCRGRMYKGNAGTPPSHTKRSQLLPSLSRAVRRSVLAEGPCVYCGTAPTDVDHIVPVMRGGTHDLSNLVPSCHTCNISKGNRPLTRWRRDRVRHGLMASPKVAAAYRLQAGLATAIATTKTNTDLPGYEGI